MRFQSISSLLLLAASAAQAASSWTFDDATVSINPKTGQVVSKKLSGKSPLTDALSLDAGASIKVSLTTKENGSAKRPHQAFLLLREVDTGVEAPFVFAVKDSGKASVDVPQKDLPIQLLLATKPLQASIVIGSFGSAAALAAPVFDVEIKLDPNSAPIIYEKPLRYGKLPEIHHIFRDDPKSPPKVVSLFFLAAVLATIPALFIGWIFYGANVSHLQKALGSAPISHALFFGSIVAMEGVFFMYYKSWNLFQTLPVMGVVSVVAFLSGTNALGEVQSRRLAGER